VPRAQAYSESGKSYVRLFVEKKRAVEKNPFANQKNQISSIIKADSIWFKKKDAHRDINEWYPSSINGSVKTRYTRTLFEYIRTYIQYEWLRKNNVWMGG